MLITILVFIAVAIRLLAGAGYWLATLRGRVRPHAVSWLFWGVTPMIAFAVQIHQHIGVQAWATFGLGIGPFVIFITTLVKHKHALQFTRLDKLCGLFAAAGVILWLVTTDPLIALFFSIFGDFCSSIPTIVKSFKHPSTEHPVPYFLSMVSIMMSLSMLRQWDAVHGAFLVYMLGINLVFFGLIYGRIGPRWRRFTQLRKQTVQPIAIDAEL